MREGARDSILGETVERDHGRKKTFARPAMGGNSRARKRAESPIDDNPKAS
jgi:hypothetical protein